MLFFSSKTIGAHLARVCRKLGIRGGAGLGWRMAVRDDGDSTITMSGNPRCGRFRSGVIVVSACAAERFGKPVCRYERGGDRGWATSI